MSYHVHSRITSCCLNVPVVRPLQSGRPGHGLPGAAVPERPALRVLVRRQSPSWRRASLRPCSQASGVLDALLFKSTTLSALLELDITFTGALAWIYDSAGA
jgi:hypothetical protein